MPLELPAYQRKELGRVEALLPDGPRRWPTSRCRARLDSARGRPRRAATCSAPTALGFRHRDDLSPRCAESAASGWASRCTCVAPLGRRAGRSLARLGEADFNVVLYPEIGGAGRAMAGARPSASRRSAPCRSAWAPRSALHRRGGRAGRASTPRRRWTTRARAPAVVDARSVDSTYLTGKRVFVFGDAHPRHRGRARRCRARLGFQVVGLGCLQPRVRTRGARRRQAIRRRAADHRRLPRSGSRGRRAAPELVLGTQMERHIAKRLGVPCAVISAPVHVQDFPARYSPQMGFEGANVLFDTWVHPLVMGLEEHLLTMFRDDFEFSDAAGAFAPRHGRGTGRGAEPEPSCAAPGSAAAANSEAEAARRSGTLAGPAQAERRSCARSRSSCRGKARRATPKRFAARIGAARRSTLDTLYEAKAHCALSHIARRPPNTPAVPVRVVDRHAATTTCQALSERAHAATLRSRR